MDSPPPFEHDHYEPSPGELQPKGDAPPRKWYRFTLWKMVLAFVLLGFIFAYLRYTHWGYVLSENITRVGRSFGLAERRDPGKIYVSAVRPLGRGSWEWSVELPEGELYAICYKVYNIPVSGDPNEIQSHNHDVPWSYSYLIDYRIERDGIVDGIHYFDSSKYLTPKRVWDGWHALGDCDWMWNDIERIAIEPSDGQQSFHVGEKIVLLRQWSAESNPPDERGATHDDGIMIWIEPAPAKGPWTKFLQQTAPTAGK